MTSMTGSFMTEGVPEELMPYKGKLTDRFFKVRNDVVSFIREVIEPATETYHSQQTALTDEAIVKNGFEFGQLQGGEPAILQDLRTEAKKRGLYNFFLPEVCGLTVLEYSPIAELLGAYPIANAAMNCSAPDTGNMEVLEKYGTAEQKKEWLEPLLEGKIRSAFAMTEPGVASSDATNISTRIERDGNDYIINGHKWWISGAIRPECKVFILMGKTKFDGPRHSQQSMIIVPRDAPGVKYIRPMHVFGHAGDHAELVFDNVRVPASNLLLGEGKGFEIAQGRLGPGRIHHCMRTIGVAEQALAAMIFRVNNRTAFGQLLKQKDTIRVAIAEARLDITKCRQLTYLAADMADEKGFKDARKYIAMIKVAAPRMALKIIDEAIQMHGAHGVSQDTKLNAMWVGIRELRLADGPDQVHLNTISQMELAAGTSTQGARMSGVNKNIAKYGKFEHVDELVGDAYKRPSASAKL